MDFLKRLFRTLSYKIFKYFNEKKFNKWLEDLDVKLKDVLDDHIYKEFLFNEGLKIKECLLLEMLHLRIKKKPNFYLESLINHRGYHFFFEAEYGCTGSKLGVKQFLVSKEAMMDNVSNSVHPIKSC